MIRVAAITSGKNVPSTRFRVRQHIDPLRKSGIDVHEFFPAVEKYMTLPLLSAESPRYVRPFYVLWEGVKLSTRLPGLIGSWKSSITWLERGIIPGIITFEPLLKRPYVFDIDDAIWLSRPFGRSAVIKMAQHAELILAGNAYLANWLSAYARDIRIVPTAVDTEHYTPRSCQNGLDHGRYVIGWIGTSDNYKYIYEIESVLQRFLETHDAELLVIADQPPRFRRLRSEWVRYKKWSAVIEAESVRTMDVGIMPLPDNEWTRGKCSLKMLQYMASGIPVVVSPVGMNEEILLMDSIGIPARNDADWYNAMDYLFKDRNAGHQFGMTGRMIAEKCFSRTKVSAAIAGVFTELA